MSSNDVYSIRETSKGVYNISHDDCEEGRENDAFARNLSLDEALDLAEAHPAEYGYRIIRMVKQEKDFEEEAKRQSRPDDVT